MPGRHFEELSGKAITLVERLLGEVGPLDAAGFIRIVYEAALQRLRLSRSFLVSAEAMALATDVAARDVLSRSYYAIYHAARAVVFAVRKSDVDDHKVLPSHLPKDLPDHDFWEKRLTFWRLTRNAADYDPWAGEEASLEALARQARAEADEFLGVCQGYLHSRGIGV